MLLACLWLCPSECHAQDGREQADVPEVVQEFLAALPAGAGHEEFRRISEEHVWDLYGRPDVSRKELERYIEKGPDGPGLAHAAVALIQFRDPTSAKVMLQKSLDAAVSAATRWYLLNAAPVVLSMGDVWYTGDGSLGEEEKEYARGLIQFAEEAADRGVGNAHASRLVQLYDPELEKEAALEDPEMSELELLRWHTSAYLLGTMDARDYSLLEPLLTPDRGFVFRNLIAELSFSANRDFMAPLRGRIRDPGFDEEEAQLAAAARQWWSDYADRHPQGGWEAAARSGFALAGYELTSDLGSTKSRSELRRALDSQDALLIYNACRLLNQSYGTRFDLELFYHGLKYALGPFSPTDKLAEYQSRLLEHWKAVLDRQAASERAGTRDP